jgi:hypothetical protein
MADHQEKATNLGKVSSSSSSAGAPDAKSQKLAAELRDGFALPSACDSKTGFTGY